MKDERIIFSNNMFLVGFTRIYEIDSVFKLITCIKLKDGMELEEGSKIHLFFTFPEDTILNHREATYDYLSGLYLELKENSNFIFTFNYTLELFLLNIESLTESTFCYIFGHGTPLVEELGHTSEITIGEDRLTGKKINDSFTRNINIDVYLCFQYASCYSSIMFTKTNINERIISVQDDSCRAITSEFLCQSVARNYLFPQENSLVSMNTRCKNNDKNLLYKNLRIDTWITFTLYSNYTVSEDSENENENEYDDTNYDDTNYDDANYDDANDDDANDDDANDGGGKNKNKNKNKNKKKKTIKKRKTTKKINKKNKKRKTMKKCKKYNNKKLK